MAVDEVLRPPGSQEVSSDSKYSKLMPRTYVRTAGRLQMIPDTRAPWPHCVRVSAEPDCLTPYNVNIVFASTTQARRRTARLLSGRTNSSRPSLSLQSKLDASTTSLLRFALSLPPWSLFLYFSSSRYAVCSTHFFPSSFLALMFTDAVVLLRG